jgi:CRISPR-associated protein Cas5t
MECLRVTIHALSAAFFAPGYNNEGCASLPVPPPSAIQGLVSAAAGKQERSFQAGWRMEFQSYYEDYEKIVPARRSPAEDDYEPYRNGYRLVRTPVKRKYLIEPCLTLYTERRFARAFLAPYHTLRLGRTQDLAWVSEVRCVKLEPVTEANVQGVVIPFPLPAGGMASFLWAVPETAIGYGERQWLRPKPFAFLSKNQRLTGLSNFYLDPETNLAVPFYKL